MMGDTVTRAADEKTEPGLVTAAWFAAFHNRPFTPDAARARLPAGADTTQPHILALAFGATGLAARLMMRRVDRIDPATLPAVLFDTQTGAPLILTQITGRPRMAHVVDPAKSGLEQEVTLSDLRRRVGRQVMLVTPEGQDSAETAESGHWFWRPMRMNTGGWVQVALAAFAINLLGLALPVFVMNVYDRVIPNTAFVTLWTLAIGVAIAIGLDWVLRSIRAGILERIGRRLDITVSATIFRHALALRPSDMPGGAIRTAATLRDFDTVRDFFGSASLVALIDLAFIFVFIAVLWLIVGPLALVPLLAIPVMLVLALASQLPLGAAVRKVQETSQRRQMVMIEALSGLETVKTLNAEPTILRDWDGATVAAARVTGQTRFWSNFASNGTQVIQQFVSVTIIVWGVFLIAEGRISIGALIAANILSGRALAPLSAIAQTIFRAQFALRAMKSISALINVRPERGDRISSAATIRKGRVEAKGISFTYPGAQVPALNNLSLTIAPGETIALVGRVGSGKSTLGKVMCGLLAPQAGTLLIDGQNAAQYDPAELRRGIGYLPQEPDLFTGTLGENLLIGAPRANQDEIAQALHVSGMEGFVASLPDGLDQFIGERGNHLSGGQRQGLALARLILRKPRLLFLDEPTNAMDRDMEEQVSRTLTTLTDEGIGLILCTHRPGLANIAKRMVVMDKGRVVLDGGRAAVVERLQQSSADRQIAGDT